MIKKEFNIGVVAAYKLGIITGTYTLDGDGLGSFSVRSEGFFGRIKRGIEERVD